MFPTKPSQSSYDGIVHQVISMMLQNRPFDAHLASSTISNPWTTDSVSDILRSIPNFFFKLPRSIGRQKGFRHRAPSKRNLKQEKSKISHNVIVVGPAAYRNPQKEMSRSGNGRLVTTSSVTCLIKFLGDEGVGNFNKARFLLEQMELPGGSIPREYTYKLVCDALNSAGATNLIDDELHKRIRDADKEKSEEYSRLTGHACGTNPEVTLEATAVAEWLKWAEVTAAKAAVVVPEEVIVSDAMVFTFGVSEKWRKKNKSYADRKLLWVVLIGLVFDLIIIQSLAASLGVSTGRVPPLVKYCLWLLAEVAVIAADIPEGMIVLKFAGEGAAADTVALLGALVMS
ncbi:hypothetical protein F3Y22_tig00004620pilonHSYRG00085 [Hibiscus syriacus]|uniref:Pentatricopeptide repeat-containing protein n=1 Tax=Hibiscus syriacus TaxID=106335 RepID=A0A6A3CG86_HIBSY|nr:hypothetical protein F3Y22_tig00004620pilonHSYRG00085 [Hibiscus syriacus]